MNRNNSIRIIATIMFCIFAFSGVAIAKDAVTTKDADKVKIKTTAKNMDDNEKIETITSILKGVEEAKMDNATKVLTVKFNPDVISSFMLVYTLEKLGFDARIIEHESPKKEVNRAQN